MEPSLNTHTQYYDEFSENTVGVATTCRVDADLKSVVYGVGISFGGEEEWNFVWERYTSSSDPYEKRLYLTALAKTRVPWLLSR